MESHGALLKHRLELKSPRFIDDLPLRMFANSRRGGREIVGIVGPEIEPHPLPCPLGDPGQKIRLHQAVLVVSPFRPWIGKQHEDRREPGVFRQGSEEVIGAGVEEVKIGQARPVFFPCRALNSFCYNV